MSEPVADAHGAIDAMILTLLGLALALDRLFFRAAIDGFSSDGPPSRRKIRKALRAQALCRTAIKVLLALRAAAESEKNLEIERTDY